MKTNFLFPNSWKTMGWVLFVLPIAITSYFWISGDSMDNFLEIKTFAIYDDNGNLITTNDWNLNTGLSAKFFLVYRKTLEKK